MNGFCAVRRKMLLGGWGLRLGLGWRGAGFCGGSEDEAFADEGEAGLGKFGLEELVFRAGEKVGIGAGDGGFEVMDGDGLAVEGALQIGIGGELDECNGAGLLGDDGP